MLRTLPAAALLLLISGASALAQGAMAPGAMAQGAIEQQPLPPIPLSPAPPPQDRLLHRQIDPIAAGPAPGTAVAPPPAIAPPMSPGAAPPGEPESGRVFCDQNVSYRMASPDSVPERYRPFLGIF